MNDRLQRPDSFFVADTLVNPEDRMSDAEAQAYRATFEHICAGVTSQWREVVIPFAKDWE